MSKDLSVAGIGSPISLKKTLTEITLNEINVFVDSTGTGIKKDAEGIVYITAEETVFQAKYYVENLFAGQIPGYLYKYLLYMFKDIELKDIELSTIKETDENYIFIKNLIAFSKDNIEALHVIGLIQLIAGSLNIARKENKGIRIYLEHPEVHLHPKRQSRFVSLLMELRKEYGKDTNS